jgi:alpha-glucosidase
MNNHNFTQLRKIKTLLAGIFFVFICTAGIAKSQNQKMYEVQSPDGTIKLLVNAGTGITYSVFVDGKEIVEPSAISMNIGGNSIPGENPAVEDIQRKEIREQIKPVVPEKFAVIENHCNELSVNFAESYSVIFRVYNNGVAYRFKTNFDKNIKVIS